MVCPFLYYICNVIWHIISNDLGLNGTSRVDARYKEEATDKEVQRNTLEVGDSKVMWGDQ